MSAMLDDAPGGRLLRATALPLAALGFLMVLNPFFAGMVLQNDYGSLYASYQLPPGELLKAFPHLMGRPFLAMAAFGVIAGLVRGRLRCTPMTALSLFGVTWLVLWFGLARQPGPHHVIVTMPLLAIAGVLHVADLLRACARPTWARLWLASALIYAGAGAIVVYSPWPSAYTALQGTDDAVLGLPGAAQAPRFRRAAATCRCFARRAAADAGRRLQWSF